MIQFLYGAKVQGIQSYIFETNRLQDIGGGSELVESLSGERFADFFHSVGVKYDPEQLLRNAAGEISYLFTHKSDCEKVVRNFEHYIATEMPGLSVSQAVVELSGDFAKLQDASRQVNRQLQIQRNRPTPPAELGWMISERARRTGRPGVEYAKKKNVLIDRRQQSKREAAKNSLRLHEKLIGGAHPFEKEDFAFNLEDITNGRERSWLAVVHADGNNLGKLIQKLLPAIPDERLLEGYRKFSETLEKATVAAAQSAYASLLEAIKAKGKTGEQEYEDIIAGKIKLPVRPVVIGGDDLTVILRAEHAVAFTSTYLAAFERETKEQFAAYAEKFGVTEHFENGLTACAGIAIIKPKYPFHYAAHLAEELCSWTKKVVKQKPFKGAPSALHFHKVQASFVEDYKDIIARELTTVDGEQLLTAGPYFVNTPSDKYKTVDQLLGYVKTLKKKETPAGPLRDYVGELRVDMGAAAQRLNRIRDLNEKMTTPLDLHDDHLFVARGTATKTSTHLYDAIQLSNL